MRAQPREAWETATNILSELQLPSALTSSAPAGQR